jgi:hypothetical protein
MQADPPPQAGAGRRMRRRKASEGVKKLAKGPKTKNAVVDNQQLTKAIFASFQFFHTFSVTAGFPTTDEHG